MELLERFRQGVPDAFEALFRQFQRDVYAWIVRIVRDPAAAGIPPWKRSGEFTSCVDDSILIRLNELLDGPNMKVYAVAWLAAMMNRDEVAKRVSPLTYVRAGLPPIITIQVDADPDLTGDVAE